MGKNLAVTGLIMRQTSAAPHFIFPCLKEFAMHDICTFKSTTSYTGRVIQATAGKSPDEEADEDQEGLELPVDPDQGTPLIPDEQGVVNVPT